MGPLTSHNDDLMINDAGKHEVKNWCGIRSRPRRPSRRRRGDWDGAQSGGAVSQGKGSGNQSWTGISTRCAKILRVAWKPKTNVVPPHCALAWVSPPKGERPRLVRCGARAGASGEHVDEVTRNTHSPEEVSGRGAAPQGRPDRRHDQRV